MIIENITQLSELLRKLGYKGSCNDNHVDLLPKLDIQLYRVIRPFLINFIDQSPQINRKVIDAFKRLFEFLPLSQPLLSEILQVLSEISQQLKIKGTSIKAEISPIAYFMVKATCLPGFPLLTFAGRDLIMNEGSVAIPALLVACSTMQGGLQRFNLSPSDILSSPDRYLKHNGQKLAEATKNGYNRLLKKLLLHVREIFSILGYGSKSLFLEGEYAELFTEEQQRRRLYFKTREIPFFSSPQVLKPHILKHILIPDKGDTNDFGF